MDGALLIGLFLLVISLVSGLLGIVFAAIYYVRGGTVMKYLTLMLATLLLFPAYFYSGLVESEVHPLRILSAMAIPLGMFLCCCTEKERNKISEPVPVL